MAEYYTCICKNCCEDCDGEFCSYECREEWESGYGDFLYEQEKDRRMMEESDHAHELINRGGL